MEYTQTISPGIEWVGGSDRHIEKFENLLPLDNGVTYNSYLITDEKTALIDTVDLSVSRQLFENLEKALMGRDLDYLVINHMEPDHGANIDEICRRYPNVKIVGNAKIFQMIAQFFDDDYSERQIEVKDKDELDLGSRSLRFYFAPMVHWPEVMFSYDSKANILFSADAFGTFGGFSGNLFSDECDYESIYLHETRRYYTNIVGKYGPQVQAAFKKLESLKIDMICPLHGPMLRGADIGIMMEKYKLWSSYSWEKKGVVIAYASMYGHTESLAHRVAAGLAEWGIEDIRMYDVSKTHFSHIVAEAFKYSHLVLAAPTYNMRLYPEMDMLLRDLAALNLQNRKVAIAGNGSWAPVAHTIMQKIVEEEMKNTELICPPMLIRSCSKEADNLNIDEFISLIAASIKQQ